MLPAPGSVTGRGRRTPSPASRFKSPQVSDIRRLSVPANAPADCRRPYLYPAHHLHHALTAPRGAAPPYHERPCAYGSLNCTCEGSWPKWSSSLCALRMRCLAGRSTFILIPRASYRISAVSEVSSVPMFPTGLKILRWDVDASCISQFSEVRSPFSTSHSAVFTCTCCQAPIDTSFSSLNRIEVGAFLRISDLLPWTR